MERGREHGRVVRAVAWLLAAGSLVTAAAACIRPKVQCTSASGFCQGEVTACEQGWEDAPVGYACRRWERREAKCYRFTDCAPYPCSQNPPPGSWPLPTFCKEGGQCCSCQTSIIGSESGTGLYYWFYTDCTPCSGGGGGED